jgi:hypothetical protein
MFSAQPPHHPGNANRPIASVAPAPCNASRNPSRQRWEASIFFFCLGRGGARLPAGRPASARFRPGLCSASLQAGIFLSPASLARYAQRSPERSRGARPLGAPIARLASCRVPHPSPLRPKVRRGGVRFLTFARLRPFSPWPCSASPRAGIFLHRASSTPRHRSQTKIAPHSITSPVGAAQPSPGRACRAVAAEGVWRRREPWVCGPTFILIQCFSEPRSLPAGRQGATHSL